MIKDELLEVLRALLGVCERIWELLDVFGRRGGGLWRRMRRKNVFDAFLTRRYHLPRPSSSFLLARLPPPPNSHPPSSASSSLLLSSSPLLAHRHPLATAPQRGEGAAGRGGGEWGGAGTDRWNVEVYRGRAGAGEGERWHGAGTGIERRGISNGESM